MRAALSLLLVAALTSCGGDDDADASAATTTGLAVGGEIELDLTPDTLPDAFPAEVPIPADIVIAGTEVLEGQSSTIFEVTGWYDGDPIRAARDYLAVLDDLGYEVTSRSEAAESLFFTADDGEWFVSAGFFPDPVRLEGTSVGVTVGPAGAARSG